MATHACTAPTVPLDLPTRLTALAVGHADALLDRLAGTRRGADSEDLHKMRVATRRLRETLLLLRSYGDPEAYRRARKRVRRLTRALGPVRALDVNLAQLKAIKEEEALPEAGYRRARDHLKRQRETARAKMLDRLAPVTEAWLGKRLERFLRTVDPSLGAEPFALNLQQRHDDLVREMEAATPSTPKSRLHELRILTKRYRYAMENADASGFFAGGDVIRLCKTVQDAIGRAHDFELLLADFSQWFDDWPENRPSGVGAEVQAVLGAIRLRETAAWRIVKVSLPEWTAAMRALRLDAIEAALTSVPAS